MREEKIKKRFLLYKYFKLRRENKKTEAITLLQEILSFKSMSHFSLEIVYLYIYFKDYTGAQERIKCLKKRDLNVEKIEILLNIKCKSKNSKEIINDIINYLKVKFDINLYQLLLKHTKNKIIKRIDFIKSKEYIDTLNLKECLFLYDYFTNDFLKRRLMFLYPYEYEFTEEYFKRNPQDEELKEYLKCKINYNNEQEKLENQENINIKNTKLA
ncbi:hypothetical protein H311_04237, partial [Anncaliia algerae PRA109]